MSDKSVLITNIQRFSLHDGPGIRTTIFMKGCPLQCPWCSNPENLSKSIQKYIKDGIEGIYGKYYSIDQLYEEIIKDRIFYSGFSESIYSEKVYNEKNYPGGVTFSGGECLMQMEALESLCKILKSEYIHMAVETSLFISQKDLELAIKYIDFFIVDVKILDKQHCSNTIHGNLEVYLKNLEYLFQSKKPVVIRVPVIAGYTDGTDNRSKVIQLIDAYKEKISKVELIKEHNWGLEKYRALATCNENFKMPDYKGISDELMEQYKMEMINKIKDVISVEVCKI